MNKRVVRVTEDEASRELSALLAHVRAGAEIVIESNAEPVAVIRPVEPHVRTLSDSLHLARQRESTVTLDGKFGSDLEEVVNSHQAPLIPPTWD